MPLSLSACSSLRRLLPERTPARRHGPESRPQPHPLPLPLPHAAQLHADLPLPPRAEALVGALVALAQRLADVPGGADPAADLGALLEPELDVVGAAVAEAAGAVAALGGADDADVAVDRDAAGRRDQALDPVGHVAQRDRVREGRRAGQAERVRQLVRDAVVRPAAGVGAVRLGVGRARRAREGAVLLAEVGEHLGHVQLAALVAVGADGVAVGDDGIEADKGDVVVQELDARLEAEGVELLLGHVGRRPRRGGVGELRRRGLVEGGGQHGGEGFEERGAGRRGVGGGGGHVCGWHGEGGPSGGSESQLRRLSEDPEPASSSFNGSKH